MNNLFDKWIEPLLSERKPKQLLEVGVNDGDHTINLLKWCRDHNARLTSLDPGAWSGNLPDEIKPAYGNYVFYRDKPKERGAYVPPQVEAIFRSGLNDRWDCRKITSLAYLASEAFTGFDIYLLDGDHNYYTLYNELDLIEPRLKSGDLILLHDVGTKWGRRDLYYDEALIPTEYINGPKQGVLTAIEDFLWTHGGCQYGILANCDRFDSALNDWTRNKLRRWPLSSRVRAALAMVRGRYSPPAFDDDYFTAQESLLQDPLRRGLMPESLGRFRFGILTRKHNGLGLIEVV